MKYNLMKKISQSRDISDVLSDVRAIKGPLRAEKSEIKALIDQFQRENDQIKKRAIVELLCLVAGPFILKNWRVFMRHESAVRFTVFMHLIESGALSWEHLKWIFSTENVETRWELMLLIQKNYVFDENVSRFFISLEQHEERPTRILAAVFFGITNPRAGIKDLRKEFFAVKNANTEILTLFELLISNMWLIQGEEIIDFLYDALPFYVGQLYGERKEIFLRPFIWGLRAFPRKTAKRLMELDTLLKNKLVEYLDQTNYDIIRLMVKDGDAPDELREFYFAWEKEYWRNQMVTFEDGMIFLI